MDIGQAFNDIWTQYGSIIMSVLTSGVFGTIVVGIVRGIISRFANKSRTATLTTSELDKISHAVAGELSGKVLDIDVSKVVTDATREELDGIREQLASLETAIKSQNEATVLMSHALGRSRLMKDDEKAALAAAADRMDVTKQKEHIAVTVEPVKKQATDTTRIKLGG